MKKQHMASRSQRYGVDPVSVSTEQSEEPPYCPHGPTLMFERFYPDKPPRKFFACAVHRDRKGCPFFVWADEKISEEKRERWKGIFHEEQSSINCEELWRKYTIIRTLPPDRRYHCPCCGVLLLESDLAQHKGHDTRSDVTDEQLLEPTGLVTPKDNKKSQAQFYFSDSSLQLLSSELKRLNFSRVLCVGTPRFNSLVSCNFSDLVPYNRLHEAISKTGGMLSLLLDIDHRYAQFYPPESYQRYNMFNSFFYSSSGKEICQEFLSHVADNKTAIVIDPPFGGLAEVLARGIKHLLDMTKKEIPIFLIFPYFMESHVIAAMPSLWMMDYQVTYENHHHFTGGKSSKPSPVRIFTNLHPPGLQLPASEGYRFCGLCNRYVARDNTHCDKCNSCTSKDGRKYYHCDLCGVCVKPGRVHCTACKQCDLPQHSCGVRGGAAVGCHICGSLEHKRRDCPEKEAPPPAKRQKLSSAKSRQKKKQRKTY